MEASSSGPSDTATFSFTVQNPIFPPTLISPAPAAYSPARLYDFTWSSSGDSYTLYIATDTQMVNLVRVYSNLLDTAFTMPAADSLVDGIYYWAVRSFVGADSSSLQLAPYLIGVDNVPPVSLDPVSPDGSSYLNDPNVTLVFQAASANSPQVIAPEFNVVEASTSPDFSTDLIRLDSLTDFTVSLAGLLSENRWYWHVERIDAAGNSSGFSTTASFLIDTTTPAVPTLVSPADGATVGSDTIVFHWNGSPPVGHATAPEYYFVHVSSDSLFGEYNIFASFVYSDSLALSSSILTNQTRYYWRVKGLDSAGFFSNYSAGQAFDFVQYICGDIDNSGGNIDIADLTMLVDHLFISFNPLPIPQAADVDANGLVDVADLTKLIDHLFINFVPLTCQ
ncbi:MAG: hypothetical protein D6800_09500 [Candidatus Zixiibacteriota bacterium]|nr:MAG: hypothetical protein D6800_09500 [candidate division Zixibacteria bacterium]